MTVKVTNNAFGTLSAGINNSVTTVTLNSGEGAKFPSLSAGEYFYATLIDTSNNLEVVKVTARSSDSLTVTRAQDNTTARAFSANDRCELRPTAKLFEDLQTEARDLNGAELILDADGDTSITADTDDQIDIKIAGADFAKMSDQTLTLTSSTASRPGLVLLDTNADAGSAFLRFQKDSASPADNDEIAAIQFYADDDGGNVFAAAQIKVVADDVSDGSENGSIRFQTAVDGTVAERIRIDASGNLLVAKTSSDGSVVGFEARATGMAIATRDNGTPLYARRIGSGSNDDEDILEFQNADGKVGAIGSLSGHLYIGDGDTAISPRNDLDSILPSNMATYGGRDDAIDIGYSSVRFDDIYASNGTIQTSDKNLKKDIASLTSAEMKVGARLSKLFKTFRWKSKVAEKGDKARTHSGIIAQDVADAFTAEGLDATKYGLYGSNTWDVDKDDQDTVIANTTKVGEKTRLSIRYPELLCFVSAYNEQRFTDIEARIKKLEDG